MIALGIESSCDETAVAIVCNDGRILAHRLRTQTEHAGYGGVVPNLAARAHLEHLAPLLRAALTDAGLGWGDIDAVGATVGPGLVGGLLVGSVAAKTLSFCWDRPFLAIDHLMAHALVVRISHPVPFPYMVLLASGGHCQIMVMEAIDRCVVLGKTRDDAAGECFDKVARGLGLAPRGDVLEALARKGSPDCFSFPIPLARHKGCDFSFSGLKTAVLDTIARCGKEQKADIAAAFQATVAKIFCQRIVRAVGVYPGHLHAFVMAGGVAANLYLRQQMTKQVAQLGLSCILPPPHLCTDNGVMVAWNVMERVVLGQKDDWATPVWSRR